jgi:hypothetical protein
MKHLFVLLCCLEVLFATYLTGLFGPFVSPIVFFGLATGIGFLYLKIVSTPAIAPVTGTTQIVSPRLLAGIQWVLFLACSFVIFSKLRHFWWYFETYGDPKSSSDVVPQIRALVQRFLQGAQPYFTIHFREYDLFPTYLPFQWFPYILTEWLQLDYRLVPAGALWLVALYYFITRRSLFSDPVWALLIPVWPLLVWGVFMMQDNNMFVFTVEGLVAAYYFMVAESLNRKKYYLLAISIAVCLLSRYSIIFWVPMCVLLLFVTGERKNALIICGTAALFFVVCYWFPFLRRDPAIFMNGYAYHTNAALGEWMRDLKVFGGQVYLYNGLGFSSYALKWLPGDEATILQTYKTIHLTACGVTVAGLGGYYLMNRKKYTLNHYLLFSLKVYLTVFYSFLQIPYKYLIIVPVFVSVAMLGGIWPAKSVKET